jgi:hypothetical protein
MDLLEVLASSIEVKKSAPKRLGRSICLCGSHVLRHGYVPQGSLSWSGPPPPFLKTDGDP